MRVISPQTQAVIKRFRASRRGYFAAWVFLALVGLSLVAELFISNRALCVYYDGHLHFPTYGVELPGQTFGLPYNFETNYRDLQALFKKEATGNWVILPLVPYSPYESVTLKGEYPPSPPDILKRHFLGTDTTGRDIFARLVFGFRTIIGAALLYTLGIYTIGVLIGSLMGYYGGWVDLCMQRLIEIWSNMPFLYVVIIITSIIKPTIGLLLTILILFSWTGMTYYFRSATYREKSRDYVAAARIIGAGTLRILILHILPNTIATLVTFFPFTLAGAITALTALDFLGFGLPPPTPSWGEIIRQGTGALSAPWIVCSAAGALVGILTLTTLIGEALREACDPKAWVTYE